MEITNVRLKYPNNANPDFIAFVSFEVDRMLAVRDCRLVRGPNGKIFLAFPDRPVVILCRRCRLSIPVSNKYCKFCGARQPGTTDERMEEAGLDRTHISCVFPISNDARRLIETQVLLAYEFECAAGRAVG